MSSTRFPGKVLAPFLGEPLILRIVTAIQSIDISAPVTVLTSEDLTDDPLVAYLQSMNIDCLRGPLEDVSARFLAAITQRPCDWFIRICADSPFPNVELMKTMLEDAKTSSADILTNTFPRTFVKGRSVEMIRSTSFINAPWDQSSPEEREHVTKLLYRVRNQFEVANYKLTPDESFSEDCVIDTLEDLYRLSFKTVTDVV